MSQTGDKNHKRGTILLLVALTHPWSFRVVQLDQPRQHRGNEMADCWQNNADGR
jgi:hypothetical protein